MLMDPSRGVNAPQRSRYTSYMRLASISAAVLVWAATALTAAPAPPPADARVPFHVGETLTYDASWSSFLTAGQVKLTVADRQALAGGRSAYHFVAEAQTVSLAAKMYQIYYKLESVLDTASLAPVRASSYSNERGRERVKSVWFGPNNVGSVEIRRGDTTKKQVPMPPRTLDGLSAMYIARALAASPGETLVIPIIDGETLSRLHLTFGGHEQVKTGMGPVAGQRVTLSMTDGQNRPLTARRVTFWLSDDAARRPIRFEAALAVGSITLTLAKVG